jgi:cell division transport system permease protein
VRPWLRQHGQALQTGLRRLSFLNALVIGIALALPVGGYALVQSLRPAGAEVALESRITLFLAPNARRADVEARLKAERRINAVRFIPREEALKELGRVQGLPEVIRALGRNPLPDAFVVSASPELADELAKVPGVAHVQADAVWARRLAAATRIARLALWLLAGLLAAGLVAVTFNTTRLQVLTQREEIEVSKLIGATDAFVRRPFYYQGLVQGLAGGLVALLVVAVSLWLLNREVQELAASYGSNFRLAYLSPAAALGVLGISASLGWAGAHLSLRRHLQVS